MDVPLDLPLLQILTNLSRDNMLSGSTDVNALLGLCTALPQTGIRYLPQLHAKVYIADQRCAIVTSANLTDSGLYRNHEYGIYLDDAEIVKQIFTDVTQYASLGTNIELQQLTKFAKVIGELKALKQSLDTRQKSTLRNEFENRMLRVEQSILQIRAESMSAHAAFADTILYLLKSGGKNTNSLYEEIKSIHSDLCDDSIKLTIKGREWNQPEWQHLIRQAQQHLKRKGLIVLENNKWSLV